MKIFCMVFSLILFGYLDVIQIFQNLFQSIFRGMYEIDSRWWICSNITYRASKAISSGDKQSQFFSPTFISISERDEESISFSLFSLVASSIDYPFFFRADFLRYTWSCSQIKHSTFSIWHHLFPIFWCWA